MTLEKSFEDVIEELEKKLTQSDIKSCQETARLTHFYQKEVSYEGAYITALMQKVQLNTTGSYE